MQAQSLIMPPRGTVSFVSPRASMFLEAKVSVWYTFSLVKANPDALKKPVKTHTLISAPERSSFAITYSSRLTSSDRVIRLVCIVKIRRFVFSSGSGNSILRSIRPVEFKQWVTNKTHTHTKDTTTLALDSRKNKVSYLIINSFALLITYR